MKIVRAILKKQIISGGAVIMCKKLKEFKESLDDAVVLSKRDFIFSITIGVLSGVIVGMVFGPKSALTIGCNNGATYLLKEDEDAPEEEA